MERYKYTLLLLLLLLFSQAAEAKPSIDSLFRAYNMRGSFLAYENVSNTFTVFYDARCKKAFPPASTFNIVDALMGLEMGIIKDTNYLFKWDGKARDLPAWDKDMNVSEALRQSCTPCFQGLEREIGADRVRFFIDKFNYGSNTFDSTFATKLDKFWMNGDLTITSYQQIYFLKNLFLNNLNAKKKNIDVIKSMMLIEDKPEYKIYGNTGTITDKRGFGWYIGWIEANSKVYFFAMNIDVRDPEKTTFNTERKELAKDIFRYMGIIK